MEAATLRAWYEDYLRAFEACGRGEADAASLLAFYAVPLLVTADEGVMSLPTEDEVIAVMTRQLEALRADGYARSEPLEDEGWEVLNGRSALHTARFSRRRADGTEIARIRATYLVAETAGGLRICALAMRSR
jgi:hypothetical protein